MQDVVCPVIITSNIESDKDVYRLNYNRLASTFEQGYNSYIMALKFLSDLGINAVTVAGADGYNEGEWNYYKSSIKSNSKHDNKYNSSVERAVRRLEMNVRYLTRSAYERG
jgi:4-hydroxy 2-oxovalerate aldolase